jgi:hypothetical protein
MMYGQPQGDPRDRITQALMNVQNPPPQPQMPQADAGLGQGMNLPAMATPGTLASMNATSPAAPNYGGVAAMSGQPQMPQMPMGAAPPPQAPGMQAPGPQMMGAPGAGPPPMPPRY